MLQRCKDADLCLLRIEVAVGVDLRQVSSPGWREREGGRSAKRFIGSME